MVEEPEALRGLRVALVHDYLNQRGGAENVVEIFAEMFPGAPLFTSVYDADAMSPAWRRLDVRTTFLQKLSPRLRFAKAFLPLYPTAFETLDLSEFDLVLSSTTAFAKGVVTRPHTCHVCYCNNPTRLFWMYHDYLQYERLWPGARLLLPLVVSPMRVWDYVAAQRPDYFIAGSHNAARRIAKYYRRDSQVLQPPIDAESFSPSVDVGEYFLVVSRLQPYKRIDLAIEACTRLGVELHVVGDGPDRARLESLAGPTVRFSGRVSDDEVRAEMARCRAFIFPGEEDFGLTPLEAQASGRPVIAYGAGGALETVLKNETGVFFSPQTVDALANVLASFDEGHFDPEKLRAHACTFDKRHFVARLYAMLAEMYSDHQSRLCASGPQ